MGGRWRMASVRRRQQLWIIFLLLAVGLLAMAALTLGPVAIQPDRLLATLLGQGGRMETAVLWVIRLPRLLLGLAAGIALALSGAALQGILRNPPGRPRTHRYYRWRLSWQCHGHCSRRSNCRLFANSTQTMALADCRFSGCGPGDCACIFPGATRWHNICGNFDFDRRSD